MWKDEKRPDVVEFMKNNFRPDFTYADFASMFTAEFYNPDEWADIFEASGAQYLSLFRFKAHMGPCQIFPLQNHPNI
jgi:alpha-L-fucosidase